MRKLDMIWSITLIAFWSITLIACLLIYGTVRAAGGDILDKHKLGTVAILGKWNSVPLFIPKTVLKKDMKFKIGTPHALRELDFVEGTVWGLQWLFRPNNAKARTRLYAYSISDALSSWEKLKAEFKDQSPTTAFILRTSTGQIQGVPIKWNEQFTTMIGRYAEIAPKKKLETGVNLIAATASEIHALSAFTSGNILTFQTAPKFLTKFGYHAMSEYNRLSAETIKSFKLDPNDPVYIAFGTKPSVLTNVGIKPQKEMLTAASADGRRLGHGIPIWPGEP